AVRRDLHAAAVEPAVRHDYVERAPGVMLAVGVEPDGGRAKARQSQPERGGVPGAAEEAAEAGGFDYHRTAQAGLGDVDEAPGLAVRAGDRADVDGADLVPGQARGGLGPVGGQAERPDEIAAGTRRYHP